VCTRDWRRHFDLQCFHHLPYLCLYMQESNDLEVGYCTHNISCALYGNAEVNKYICACAKCCEYICFEEPCWMLDKSYLFNLDNFKKYVIMHNVVPGLQIFRQFVSTFGAVSIVLLRQCGLLIFWLHINVASLVHFKWLRVILEKAVRSSVNKIR
jgi:hypothetical protein